MGNEIILVILMGIFTLAGALIGAVIAPRFNHKYSMEKLKEEHEKRLEYMKEEIFFKNKLEYFEEISEKIQEEIGKIFLIKEKLKHNQQIKELPNLTAFYKDRCELYFNGLELLEKMNDLAKMGLEMNDLIDNIPKNKRKNYIKKIEALCKRFINKKLDIINLMKKELKNYH